ncbi:hypothetical protein ACLRDI_03425 [Pseudomonas piscis]
MPHRPDVAEDVASDRMRLLQIEEQLDAVQVLQIGSQIPLIK